MPDLPAIVSKPRRVLVIDDDRHVAETTKIMLEAEHYEVVVAEHGRAGLEVMRSGHFDLAIVDLFMPGMDGLATTKALRRIDPTMPVIAISGFMFRGECPDMPQFSAMAKEAGALATLYKPFRRHELMDVIRMVAGAA
jgi:CheY-like chemotaxis protein